MTTPRLQLAGAQVHTQKARDASKPIMGSIHTTSIGHLAEAIDLIANAVTSLCPPEAPRAPRPVRKPRLSFDLLLEGLRHHAEAAGRAVLDLNAPNSLALEAERGRVVKDLHDAIEELEELRTEVLELRQALSEEQGDRPPWALDCSRDAQAIVRALLLVGGRVRDLYEPVNDGADSLHGIESTLTTDLLNAGRGT